MREDELRSCGRDENESWSLLSAVTIIVLRDAPSPVPWSAYRCWRRPRKNGNRIPLWRRRGRVRASGIGSDERSDERRTSTTLLWRLAVRYRAIDVTPAVTGWPSTRPWMKDICPRTSAPVHLIPSLSKTTIVDICALGPNSNPIRDPDSKS